MAEDTSCHDGEGVQTLDAVTAQVALGHPVSHHHRCWSLRWLLRSDIKVSSNNASVTLSKKYNRKPTVADT